MKKRWKQFHVWAITISICMLVLGIAAVIWPEISAVAVCCILGVICIGSGVYEIVRYFNLGLAGLFFQHDFALGIFNVLAGILLLIHPLGAATFLPVAAGVYMIMGSVFDIQMSVEMRRIGVGNWAWSMALGIINTVFAFFLILNPFQGAAALMIYMGIMLVIDSIQNLHMIHCISKAMKEQRDPGAMGSSDVIDAPWEPLE